MWSEASTNCIFITIQFQDPLLYRMFDFHHAVQNLPSSRLLSKNVNIKTYETIILPLVLHGCEPSSLTLREDHKLRVFGNGMLRRIFGVKRDEVTGGWRKLHNKELRNLNCSPSIIRLIKSRRMRWAGHVARMGEKRNVYRLRIGKPAGKKPLGRPRRRWLYNIKTDFVQTGWGGIDRIGLDQDRYKWRALVSAVMNLRVP
jgi:hypothetical protein